MKFSWKSDQKYQLQMHENHIFMQFFMSFYGWQLQQLYTANFLYGF